MPRPSLVSQGKPRKYEIQYLQERHHQILRLSVLGFSLDYIAETVGMSKVMVSTVVNSAIAQDLIRVMRGTLDKNTIDVGLAIRELAPKAVKVLEEAMESESEKIRLTAAMDLLDRGGFPAQKNISIQHSHQVTANDLMEIKRRAEAAGLIASSREAIEGEVVEEPTSTEGAFQCTNVVAECNEGG
jgi:hypothetical protein